MEKSSAERCTVVLGPWIFICCYCDLLFVLLLMTVDV
jgi:hypothetical protein